MLDTILGPPPDEAIQVQAPPPGTITPLSSGTGAVVSIEWLREIDARGLSRGELGPLIEAIEELEVEEDMVSAWPEDTGVANALKILPRSGASHGPRIKVAIDPPNRFRTTRGGVEASVPFDATSISDPVPAIVPASLLQQVRAFIDINRDALIAFYNEEISGIQLAQRLRPIAAR